MKIVILGMRIAVPIAAGRKTNSIVLKNMEVTVSAELPVPMPTRVPKRRTVLERPAEL